MIDLFSIKPLDSETIINEALKCKSKTILNIEDHYGEGGIYGKKKKKYLYYKFDWFKIESVCMGVSMESEIRCYGLYVNDVPRSG